jgi:hypothetical protein
MQNCFTPVANSLLHERRDWVDFHSLCAPAKVSIGRRVAATDNINPKRFFASVPSIISTIAGISTRVSVQRTDTGFVRCGAGMLSTTVKIMDASIVLSLPPLKPTSQGRWSVTYRCRSELRISKGTPN